MRTYRTKSIVALVALIAILLLSLAQIAVLAANPELGANEIKLGEEAAAEAAKQYKLGGDSADLKRIRDIGAKIAAAANTELVPALYGNEKITKFPYAFEIIEDKDINAFCVPGGRIYVFRGLLNFVESDDELACIIAHEATHAAHHHMVYLIKRQAALENAEAIALLAAIMGGVKGSDMANIAQGVTLLNIAKMNGYGMQAERDADLGAIRYAMTAGYNPVGLLTFMERLARRPEFVDLGIYRSHPLDADRVKATKDLLAKLKVPINRRAVTKSAKAEVAMEKIGGVDVAGVKLSGNVIYRAGATADKTSQQLAQVVADRINAALDSGIKIHELKTDAAGGAVAARDKVIVVVTEADAKLMDSTPSKVAQSVSSAVRSIILMQMVDTVH